ncbi:hypothetical protein M5585_18625 [Serratia ureilytica]
MPLCGIKGSAPQNKRNSVSLLLNWHVVIIMLGGRKATARGALSLPRSAVQGRRFLPPLRTENHPCFSPFRTAHCPLFVHARQKR